jgi:hypothetical protein
MKPDVTYKNVFTTPSVKGEGLSVLVDGSLKANGTVAI